jgi:Ala-tRNA(Pro) deacylase
MQIPDRLIDFLNENKVKYQIVHHPEAFTAQELAAVEHVKGRDHAKVVMVTSDGQQIMVVLPTDHQVDLDKLEGATGKAASLSTEDQFKALFPDCSVGAMPPFGGLYGVPTFVDKALTYDEFIVFEAGTHTDAIKMTYDDYARLAKPTVLDFALKIHPIKAA